jgi:Ca2+-dependent lipid-binding protein
LIQINSQILFFYRNVELVSKQRKSGRGQLNYEASFFPTLALAKEATKEELEAKSKEISSDKNAAADDSKDKETTVTETLPVAPTGPPEKDLHGEPIHYTEDKKINLMSYSSGVLSVKVHEVSLPSKAKAVAEILLDSNDAQFRTTPVKGNRLQFNECGDAFVKEMDLSRLIVRVRDAKDDYKDDDRIGFWTSPVQDIVKSIQNRPAPAEGEQATDEVLEYTLLDSAGGKIKLSFKFIPVVQFKLDPSESLESKFKKKTSIKL